MTPDAKPPTDLVGLHADTAYLSALAALESGKAGFKLLDPAKCSIAVLPFNNNSGDPEQDYFADGITEDLLIELTRQRHLAVASRHSCFVYKEKSIDAREAGAKLGVDFIVEGSIQKSGQRIRITAQLSDCKTGAQVWSNRYDRALDDVFALQDEIVTTILGGLSYNLDEAASNQRRQDPTASMSAYGAYLQARTASRRGDEVKEVEYLYKAIDLDPRYARALARLAFVLALSRFSFTSELVDGSLVAEANALSERALAADRFDPFVLGILASSHVMLGNPRKARQLADAAWEISPRDLDVMATRGFVLTYCGLHKEGVGLLEAACALEPHLPSSFVTALAEGRYMMRDYAGALESFDRLLEIPADQHLTLGVVYGQLGRLEEAKAMVARAVTMSPPKFDPLQVARMTTQMCAERSDAEHWLEGYRKAGIEV